MLSTNKNWRYKAVTENIPLVSVIIPMYNAVRFISLTLESLAYQTMQDFEVIVVDDCSTDNSVMVVESFAERFKADVPLHVIKLPTNTGMPYLPRNVGIQFARGKYLVFLDNDDLFTKTALEELSTLAEEYQADVINMPDFFLVKDKWSKMKDLVNPANHTVWHCAWSKVPRPEQVQVVSDDIAERVRLWLDNGFHWATYALFCRKDFWIANRLNFPHMPVSDDMLAIFSSICFAKKLLRVPNVTYIHRERADSISQEKTNAEKFIHRWVSNLTLGFRALEEILDRLPFFKEHPDYRYAVSDWFFNRAVNDAAYFPTVYSQVPPATLKELVTKEFHSEDVDFAAYLFNTVNIQRLQIMRLQQELAKFQKQ